MTLKDWQRRERRRRILLAILAWVGLTTAAVVTIAALYGGLVFWLVMAR